MFGVVLRSTSAEILVAKDAGSPAIQRVFASAESFDHTGAIFVMLFRKSSGGGGGDYGAGPTQIISLDSDSASDGQKPSGRFFIARISDAIAIRSHASKSSQEPPQSCVATGQLLNRSRPVSLPDRAVCRCDCWPIRFNSIGSSKCCIDAQPIGRCRLGIRLIRDRPTFSKPRTRRS